MLWPEAARLAALRRHDILDTPAEEEFDDFTRLAAHICDTPIALISLVDRERQWFKAERGLGLRETPLDVSFCKYAILHDGLFVVPDACADPRFRDNPLVTGPTGIRFYVGAPLKTRDNLPLGTLCVLDRRPRDLDEFQRRALEMLSRQVMVSLELRLAQRRLRAAVESISEAFVTLDRDLRFTYLNAQAEKNFRVKKERLLGRVIWEGCRLGEDGPFGAPIRDAVGSGIPARFEAHYDPTGVWLEVSVDPSPEGVTLYVRNVTERRNTEEQLRLLQSTVARLNDMVVITEAAPLDEPGPRIVYVNDTFVERTGYRREEVLGRSPRFLQGPGTRRSELDRVRVALGHGRPVRVELINYTKSGQPLWLELDITPLMDAAAQRGHWVAVARDVGERKQAEEAADEMRRRLETLIGQAKIGILVHRDFRPLIANEELARIFGYGDTDQILGVKDCRALFAEEERPRLAAYYRERLEGGSPLEFNSFTGVRKDGSHIQVESRAFPIHWGDSLAVCAMLTDVTDQRRMEAELRQSQRLESLGQLTGGIAHDFNNLLTVILGNAELLEEKLSGDHSLSSLAETTRTAAERGAELTRRLLAFARKQPLDPRPIHVGAMIGDMKALLGRTLGEHIDIRVDVAESLSSVVADPSELENALINLCVNARDAMPRGGRLSIEADDAVLDDHYARQHADVTPGQYVRIAVSDTGTGMDKQTLAHAFEPFFTTKEAGKGTGLGLSTIYGFVKQSGGHVSIYSEPGHGTTVRLYLPKAVASIGSEGDAPGPGVLRRGSGRVLVAEDDAMVRIHVTAILDSLGYDVVAVQGGSEALALIESGERFDLLLTDVIMPGGMNGFELAKAARHLRPDLPVLFTSGYAEGAIQQQGAHGRAVPLLQKPYRRHEVAAKVMAALEQRQH